MQLVCFGLEKDKSQKQSRKIWHHTYTLQGFRLLSRGSTIGAGPSLSSIATGAMRWFMVPFGDCFCKCCYA